MGAADGGTAYFFADDPSVHPSAETATSDGSREDEADRDFVLTPASKGFGDYVLLEEISRGGMGVVFRARQREPNRVVALKMILATHLATESDIRRFRTEAEAAARLDHPGIVAVHEVGEHDGQHYFTMPLVPGGTLEDLLRETAVEPRRAVEILVGITEAVRYAHDRNIVHRDLKPGNVLLDESGHPKVADFGLAKLLDDDSGLTKSGDVHGTPNYMSPEQAVGKPGLVGPPADVYALGGILYTLLTRRPPFHGRTTVETLRQVVDDDPVPPSRHNRAVDADLETICLKCLEKEPSARYASAAHLLDELQRYLAGRPITARRTGPVRHLARWYRRRPVQALLATGLVVSILLGIAGTSTFAVLMLERAREADRNARSANAARRQAELNEYRSLVGKVRLQSATRLENGWTWPALADLERAASLDASRGDEATLRTLAARCLGAFDVRPVGQVAAGVHTGDLAFSADGQRLYVALSKKVPTCPVLEFDASSRTLRNEYPMPTVNAAFFARLAQGRKFQSGFRAVAVDPTGRWLAGGTRFGRVVVWRVGESAPVWTLEAFDEEVFGLRFSPDGTTLVATPKYHAKNEPSLRVWRMDDTNARWSFEREVTGVGRSIAFAPDGRHLVHASGGKLGLLDLREWDEVGWAGEAKGDAPAYSSRGCLVAADRSSLVVYSTDDRRPMVTRASSDPELRHDGDQLQVVGDTAFVVSGSGVDRLRVHDLVTGESVATIPTRGRRSGPFAVSPDGRMLAVAEMDAVALYEIRTPESSTCLPVGRGIVESCDVDGTGERIAWLEVERDASGISKSRVRVVEAASGAVTPITEVVRGTSRQRPDDDSTGSVRFLADGRVAVHESLMGLHPIRTAAGAKLPPEVGSIVDSAAFVVSPTGAVHREDETTVVEVDDRGVSVRVPRTSDGQDLSETTRGAFLRCSAEVAPGTRLLVDAGSDEVSMTEPGDRWCFLGIVGPGNVDVRMRSTGAPIRVVLHEVRFVPVDVDSRTQRYDVLLHQTVAVAPDARRMWAVVDDEALHAWSLSDGRLQYTFRDAAQAIHFGPHRLRGVAVGERRLVVGMSTGQVDVLDTVDGHVVSKVPGPGGEISSQALSSDESWFVAGTDRGRVGAWNVDGTILGIADGTGRAVTAIEILDDDGLVATGTVDGEIAVWGVSNDGWNEQLRLGPFGGSVRELRWSPGDGKLVYLIEGERTVHVLDLSRLDGETRALGLPSLLRPTDDGEAGT